MTAPRLVLICHKAPFGRAMAAALQARFGAGPDAGLVGVLGIDRPVSRLHKLRQGVRNAVRMSSLERRVRRIEQTLSREADQAFETAASPPADWPAGVAVHLTSNPNAPDCVDWLSALQPDILAVTGAPILRPPVFELPRLGTLNMHSSLLPAYRGTQAEFWQVLEGGLDTCGVTVHFVNAGVDTGHIVLQRATPAEQGISPQALRTRNLLVALDLVPEAIAAVADGSAEPQPQGSGDGVTRRSRDRTLETRARLLMQLGYDGLSV